MHLPTTANHRMIRGFTVDRCQRQQRNNIPWVVVVYLSVLLLLLLSWSDNTCWAFQSPRTTATSHFIPSFRKRKSVEYFHCAPIMVYNCARNWDDHNNGESKSELRYSSSSSAASRMNGGHTINSYFHGFNTTTVQHMRVNGDTIHVGKQQQQQQLVVSNDTSSYESSVMSSVTHWSDIMRQGWLDDEDHLTKKNKYHSNYNNATTKTLLLLDSVISDQDLEQIEMYWDRLLPTVNYLGTVQVARIYKALCVAYRAHLHQRRKSGEPFIIHPVEVALLLAGLKMDGDTVIAGLLHDTVEDTELTFAQVEALFGKTVRSIVEGETKVSKLPKQLAFTEYADEQAENLRQMFVAMTDDYRIIIVKLADRLHNMRTLKHMKPEKQIKISRETLDIFAPLAHRMGIWQFKSELEDTAFMYLYPLEYKRLNRRLLQHQKQFRETLDKSQELLQRRLDNDPTLRQQAAKVEVSGRTKEIYSLWHKMETKNEHNLDNIMDLVALRVVIMPKPAPEEMMLNNENETDRGVWLCYHVLGLVQHLHGFQPVPTRVKDYISFPKPNGYQSLHTALRLNGQTIEVQIRTKMVAEYGMASHWAYKDGQRRKLSDDDQSMSELYNTPWLSSIKEWQNDKLSSRDFVDSVRRELLGKRVFVFLRNGKILNLARGATAIDAAFQIHTEVGLKMHGVEVNGKPVPLSYELRNGDVVSILTGQGKPATDWMRYAKSRSTRSKLRSYFRAKQRESLREAGKILLMDFLWIHADLIQKSSYLEEDFRVPTLNVEEIQHFLPGRSQYEEVDDLLIALGKEHSREMLHKVVSQIFEVPKKVLFEAEEKRRSSRSVPMMDAVLEGRRRAQDVALKLSNDSSQEKRNGTYADIPSSNTINTARNLSPQFTMENLLKNAIAKAEYADHEHLCKECLPVHGDSIVGTRPLGSDATIIPTVHRMGCPHAQRAINNAWADQRHASIADPMWQSGPSILSPGPKVDSVFLRQYTNSCKSIPKGGKRELPVKLEWMYSGEENRDLFLAEVVVVAHDRKLLLADCSEIVSETVEILKTGSASNEEHATLVFLVQVKNVDNLQELIRKLKQIRSVVSVERRFGSELLMM